MVGVLQRQEVIVMRKSQGLQFAVALLEVAGDEVREAANADEPNAVTLQGVNHDLTEIRMKLLEVQNGKVQQR